MQFRCAKANANANDNAAKPASFSDFGRTVPTFEPTISSISIPPGLINVTKTTITKQTQFVFPPSCRRQI